tara:strand:+ start:273 stop:506 length:234 start_codon:yes stop_codon:yes gene_type:complete
MFKKRILVIDPKVLIREEVPPSDFKFIAILKKGDFYLVKPKVAREVYYLQMLGKNIALFLPTEGEGLLVRRADIDNL